MLARFCQLDANWSHLEAGTSTEYLLLSELPVSMPLGYCLYQCLRFEGPCHCVGEGCHH